MHVFRHSYLHRITVVGHHFEAVRRCFDSLQGRLSLVVAFEGEVNALAKVFRKISWQLYVTLVLRCSASLKDFPASLASLFAVSPTFLAFWSFRFGTGLDFADVVKPVSLRNRSFFWRTFSWSSTMSSNLVPMPSTVFATRMPFSCSESLMRPVRLFGGASTFLA